jgi:hypothetical protein
MERNECREAATCASPGCSVPGQRLSKLAGAKVPQLRGMEHGFCQRYVVLSGTHGSIDNISPAQAANCRVQLCAF